MLPNRHRPRPTATWSLIALTAAGLTPLTLHAQDAAAEPASSDEAPAAEHSLDLGTMVVSGEKIQRTAMESTTSASIHNAEDIERNGDESLGDLLRRVANANFNEEGRVSIRGISQNGAANGTGAPLISVQVDGVTLDRNSQQSSVSTLFDVEQVEILRGAQSTSQGRNALGGAMIVRTKEPTWVWDSVARAGLGSRNAFELGYAGGGPITNSLAFRISGLVNKDDGYITHLPTNDDEYAKSRTEVGRFKLAWAPMGLPGLSSRLGISKSKVHGKRVYNVEPGEAASDPQYFRTNSMNDPAYNDVDSRTGSWETVYDFGDVQLTAVTGWMDSAQDYLLDYDGLEYDDGALDVAYRGENVTQEIRLNLSNPEVYSGVIGVYGGRFDTSQLIEAEDVPYVESPRIEADYEQEIVQRADNIALFAEFDIELPWSLTATLGLRYDREELDSRDRFETTSAESGGLNVLPLVLASGQTPDTNGFQGAVTTYDALLPKAGLRAAITEQWSIFVTYNEAYRAGGVDVDTQSGEAVAYDPEYTKNYEVGTRLQLSDLGVSLSANAYYVEWEDQQVPVLSGSFFITQNAANSRLYGAETSMRWAATDTLSLDLVAGYAHTEFLEFVQNGEDYSGNEFVYAPKHTGSIGMNWTPSEQFSSTVSYSHTGMSFTQPDNLDSERGDERQLLDARMAWTRGHWRLSFVGKNLLDEDYVSYSFQYPNGVPGDSGPRGYATYGRPRTFFGFVEWFL